jgi:predicted AAA+ superfamily ATPase
LRHDELFFWAPTEDGTEVDFLIRRGKEFTPIEVKAGENLSSHDLKGLKAVSALENGGRRDRLVGSRRGRVPAFARGAGWRSAEPPF